MLCRRSTALLAVLAVVAVSITLPQPSPAEAQTTFGFADVSSGSTHGPAVYALVEEGVVQGCTVGAYCPEDAVTREQMATFIGRALGLPRDGTKRFNDVDPSSTHGGYVGALAKAGITTGCGGGDYCPRDPVSREQMATFLMRAYDLPTGSLSGFSDVSGGTHGPGIGAVARANVTAGCTSSTFCPKDEVTRAQMASFMARAMGLLLSSRGCPVTVGPNSLSNLGVAAPGYPVNSAELVGNHLFVFSIDLDPAQMVVYNVDTGGLSKKEIPTGKRTWAVHAVGNTVYFGQDGPPHRIYRTTRTGGVHQVRDIPGLTGIWDITSDDQGRLYVGTSDARTVHRITNPGGSNPTRHELKFSGPGTAGQVTQVEWHDGDLYVGTGRGSGNLLRIPDTATWTPSTTRTAEPLPLGVDSPFGVYSLAVTDDQVVAGTESPGRLVVFDRRVTGPGVGGADAGTSSEPRSTELEDGADSDGSTESDPDTDAGMEPSEDELEELEHDGPDSDAEADSDDATVDPGSDDPDPDATERTGTTSTLATDAAAQTISGHGTVEHTRRAIIAPPTTEGAITSLVVAGNGTIYASGRSEGNIYRVAPGGSSMSLVGPELQPSPAPLSPTRAMFLRNNDSQLLGVAAPSVVWTSNLTGGEFGLANLVAAGAPSAPARPQSITVGSGRVLVGTNNSVTVHNLSNGTRKAVPVPGEPKTMTPIGDNVYVGMYPAGALHRLNPATHATSTVGTWDDDHGRPMDMHHDTANNRLRVAAQVTHNSSAPGALVSFNTSNWTFQRNTNFGAPGLRAVTTHGDRTIVGTTGSNARLESRSTSGAQQWSTTPVPGGGAITSLVTVGNRVHGLTQDGYWFEVNPTNGSLVSSRQVLGGGAGQMQHDDGWLYAVTRECLIAIDLERGRVETLQDRLSSNTFGQHVVTMGNSPRTDRAFAYVIRNSNLVRVTHNQR